MAIEVNDVTLGVLLSGLLTGVLISGALAILQRKDEKRKAELEQFAKIYPQYFDENIKRNRLNARVIVVKWREDPTGTIAICEAWFLESKKEEEVKEMMKEKSLTDEHMTSLSSLLNYWTFISKYSKVRGVNEKMLQESLSYMLAWFSPFFSDFCCHMARTDEKGQLWKDYQQAENTRGKDVIKAPWVKEIPELIKRWDVPNLCKEAV